MAKVAFSDSKRMRLTRISSPRHPPALNSQDAPSARAQPPHHAAPAGNRLGY